MQFNTQDLSVHSDPRGFVFEPLNEQLLKKQRNVHVVVTVPGAVRGNHFHRQGTETIAVVGPALVRVKHNREVKDIEVPTGKIYCFTFPPGLSHAIQNTGRQANLLIAFNTVQHTPDNPDVCPDKLI
jgi:UDP-2-acetamido-2,6-beta-L-arabino-hexul-4-ose reductase